MGGFLAPQNTGYTLQLIAKLVAVVTILAAILGTLALLETSGSGLGILYGAAGAGVFSSLLLHGFGVLVDSAYQQRLQAEKQTELLHQLLAQHAASAKDAPAPATDPRKQSAPHKAAVMPVQPSDAEREHPRSGKNVMEAGTQVAMTILGHLLSLPDQQARDEYLLEMMRSTRSERISTLCRQAMGMDQEKILEMIDRL